MVFIAFFLSFLCFFYAALAPIFDWVVSSNFSPIAWGLTFLALGFLIPGAYTTYRTRGLPRP